jgi:hypothetical protein
MHISWYEFNVGNWSKSTLRGHLIQSKLMPIHILEVNLLAMLAQMILEIV